MSKHNFKVGDRVVYRVPSDFVNTVGTVSDIDHMGFVEVDGIRDRNNHPVRTFHPDNLRFAQPQPADFPIGSRVIVRAKGFGAEGSTGTVVGYRREGTSDRVAKPQQFPEGATYVCVQPDGTTYDGGWLPTSLELIESVPASVLTPAYLVAIAMRHGVPAEFYTDLADVVPSQAGALREAAEAIAKVRS